MSEDIDLGQGLICFIISPIGNKLEPLGSAGRSRYEESILMWEEVFEPAAKEFGMAPIRADRIADPGEIPDQIFTYLRDADVVIADLSHANANVMYELGLRHSRADKVTVQVGEYERLPFDVTTIRTIQFKRTTAGLISARDELIEALRAALNGGATALRATSIFGQPSADLLTNVPADVARSVASEPGQPEVEEPGIVEILAEGEGALQNISAVLGAASDVIIKVGAKSSEFAERIGQSDANSKGFADRLLITRELAADLVDPSSQLEAHGNEFYDDVSRMDTMIQYVINRFENGDEESDEASTFFTSILSLVDSAEEGAVGIVGFRDGARSMAKMSSALSQVSKTLSQAANRFLEGIAVISAWREPIQRLVEIEAA